MYRHQTYYPSTLTKDFPLLSFGQVNMKSNAASMFAIFMAARFWNMTPRMVSNGLECVRAFLISSPSRSSNIDLHLNQEQIGATEAICENTDTMF